MQVKSGTEWHVDWDRVDAVLEGTVDPHAATAIDTTTRRVAKFRVLPDVPDAAGLVGFISSDEGFASGQQPVLPETITIEDNARISSGALVEGLRAIGVEVGLR